MIVVMIIGFGVISQLDVIRVKIMVITPITTLMVITTMTNPQLQPHHHLRLRQKPLNHLQISENLGKFPRFCYSFFSLLGVH